MSSSSELSEKKSGASSLKGIEPLFSRAAPGLRQEKRGSEVKRRPCKMSSLQVSREHLPARFIRMFRKSLFLCSAAVMLLDMLDYSWAVNKYCKSSDWEAVRLFFWSSKSCPFIRDCPCIVCLVAKKGCKTDPKSAQFRVLRWPDKQYDCLQLQAEQQGISGRHFPRRVRNSYTGGTRLYSARIRNRSTTFQTDRELPERTNVYG